MKIRMNKAFSQKVSCLLFSLTLPDAWSGSKNIYDNIWSTDTQQNEYSRKKFDSHYCIGDMQKDVLCPKTALTIGEMNLSKIVSCIQFF